VFALAGQFKKGNAGKLRWCPFMSGAMIPKNCDGDKCMLWFAVRNPDDNRVVKSGCSFAVLVELLSERK